MTGPNNVNAWFVKNGWFHRRAAVWSCKSFDRVEGGSRTRTHMLPPPARTRLACPFTRTHWRPGHRACCCVTPSLGRPPTDQLQARPSQCLYQSVQIFVNRSTARTPHDDDTNADDRRHIAHTSGKMAVLLCLFSRFVLSLHPLAG